MSMSEVPQGWTRTRLRGLLSESEEPGSTGLTADKLTVKLYGKGVLAKHDRVPGSVNTRYFRRRSGQFIYSRLDFLNGAFGIIPPELDGRESTADLPAFDILPTADPAWLLYFVSRPDFYERHGSAAIGSRKARRISPDELLALELFLPPLPEQKKIAAILSSVDEAIQATQRVIDQTRRVKEGLLQDLLTRGLPGHTRFKQTEIGEIPEEWEVRQVGSLIVGNPTNGLSPKEADSGVPTFSIAAIRNGRIDITENLKYADVDPESSKHFRVKTGDILLVRGNANPAYVGSAGVVLNHPEGCIYPDILMRLVPCEQVDPIFLLLSINSRLGHDQLLKKAKTTNGTLKVNGQDVQTTKLPLPSLAEQRSIVEQVTSASDAGSVASHCLSRLTSLKAGLLQDLLTGKVRVTP